MSTCLKEQLVLLLIKALGDSCQGNGQLCIMAAAEWTIKNYPRTFDMDYLVHFATLQYNRLLPESGGLGSASNDANGNSDGYFPHVLKKQRKEKRRHPWQAVQRNKEVVDTLMIRLSALDSKLKAKEKKVEKLKGKIRELENEWQERQQQRMKRKRGCSG